LTNIDGIWPDDERTPGLTGLAKGPRLLRSAKSIVRAPLQIAPTAIWTIIDCVERGFADFARIPYHDGLAHLELSQLLDEFGA
jgi:hypothetical protein